MDVFTSCPCSANSTRHFKQRDRKSQSELVSNLIFNLSIIYQNESFLNIHDRDNIIIKR